MSHGVIVGFRITEYRCCTLRVHKTIKSEKKIRQYVESKTNKTLTRKHTPAFTMTTTRTSSSSRNLVIAVAALATLGSSSVCEGFSTEAAASSRREALGSILGGGAAVASAVLLPGPASAVDTMDVDDFLRTGGVSMPMGVSGQAGKSKPETGVLLREGTDISRDTKSGNVLAEILVQKTGSSSDDMMAVVTSFQSPWPLGK